MPETMEDIMVNGPLISRHLGDSISFSRYSLIRLIFRHFLLLEQKSLVGGLSLAGLPMACGESRLGVCFTLNRYGGDNETVWINT